MKARAIIKTDYYGKTLLAVNVKGRGTSDCDRKVAVLAEALDGRYWETQYDCWWPFAQVLTFKNHNTWRLN